MHFTSTVLIRELTERLLARGVPIERIEREVDAKVPSWGDPDARWPLVSFASLVRIAIAELDDPALGLHIAETLPAERQHVAFRIATTSRTLREASAAWARYAALVSTADRLVEVREGGRSRIVYDPDPSAPALPFMHEHYLVLARRTLELWGPLDRLGASFEVAHAAPAYAAEYRRLLGPRVNFGAARTAIAIDEAALDAPLPRADPYLGALLRDAADRWLAGLEQRAPEDTLVSRVLATLEGLDDLGAGALRSRVADALGVSEKSLQRRLRQEGHSFRELLDRYRRERALTWVREGRPTVDVAWSLGFSETAAFTRAFRRWSGTTVARWRRGEDAVAIVNPRSRDAGDD